MSKNRIQHIIIHEPDNINLHALADRVNEFHVGIIERRLNHSSLSAKQKSAVVDKILSDLKSREVSGFIK